VTRHHSPKHGLPVVDRRDLFILVKEPMSKRPRFYVGHVDKVHHFTPLRSQAKVLDYLCAKLWAEHLIQNGHEVFVCSHEVKVVKHDPKIPTVPNEPMRMVKKKR
jgi:hypothetical protein